MAGILFLLDALAFVLVLHWAFERRGSKQANAETGWFGMRSTEADAAADSFFQDRTAEPRAEDSK